jgi:hypothetical protein
MFRYQSHVRLFRERALNVRLRSSARRDGHRRNMSSLDHRTCPKGKAEHANNAMAPRSDVEWTASWPADPGGERILEHALSDADTRHLRDDKSNNAFAWQSHKRFGDWSAKGVANAGARGRSLLRAICPDGRGICARNK